MNSFDHLNQDQLHTLINKLQSKLNSHRQISHPSSSHAKNPTLSPVYDGTDWSMTAFGLIIAYRPPPFHVFETEFLKQWDLEFPCVFKLKGNNLFEITFHSAADRFHVCQNAPWTVAGYYVNIRSSFHTANFHYLDLQSIPIWVGVFDLPFGFESGENVAMAAMHLGSVMLWESEQKFLGIDPYFRFKVLVDARKPRIFKSRVEIPDRGSFPVRFKYENLATHCIFCGVLGHRSERCITRMTKGFEYQKESFLNHSILLGKSQSSPIPIFPFPHTGEQNHFPSNPIPSYHSVCKHDLILDGPCGCEGKAKYMEKVKRESEELNSFSKSNFIGKIAQNHSHPATASGNMMNTNQMELKDLKEESNSFLEEEPELSLNLSSGSTDKKRKSVDPVESASSRKRKTSEELVENENQGLSEGWWSMFEAPVSTNLVGSMGDPHGL